MIIFQDWTKKSWKNLFTQRPGPIDRRHCCASLGPGWSRGTSSCRDWRVPDIKEQNLIFVFYFTHFMVHCICVYTFYGTLYLCLHILWYTVFVFCFFVKQDTQLKLDLSNSDTWQTLLTSWAFSTASSTSSQASPSCLSIPSRLWHSDDGTNFSEATKLSVKPEMTSSYGIWNSSKFRSSTLPCCLKQPWATRTMEPSTWKYIKLDNSVKI